MDKFIFRAKTLCTGKWVYGYYVAKTDPLLGIAYHYILNQEYNSSTGLLDSFISWYRVDPDTVCRCTGLKDKNGTYIFEHDILYGTIYHMFEDKGMFEVRWNNHVASFEANAFEPMKCEVIGDIFDNTNLMEG